MAATDDKVGVSTVERAVNALLKWRCAKTESQKAQLLEQDDFIYLILTLKKIPPKSRTNAYKIPLPHPLHSGSELCLIIDDRAKSNLTSETAKKKIKAEDIPISKVIKLSKLKTDYKPFEAKRKLCDSYDMFFADKRVIPLLPKLLGKNFFTKKKLPVPVNLDHNNWKEQIERACSSAMLYLRTGTCSVMKVGKSSMEKREIVENVVGAIEGIVGLVHKKWEGIRSLHLKFTESLALPIYQAVPEMKMKIDGKRKFDEVAKEESGGEEDVGGEKSGAMKKKKKTKGRIHEVKYMDADIDTFGDELGSGDDEEEKIVKDKKSGNEGIKSKRKEVKKLKDGAKGIKVKKSKKSSIAV